MKKAVYAVCGTAMITTAVLVRSLGDGGSELVALLLADLPANQRRGMR